ncbi:MAG: hypothetical protein K6F37_07940 [Lachnospiraceae bacterium]|nr:hypothetical protein [Lachnospiraceae bacterium]
MREIGSEFWTVENENGAGLKSLLPYESNAIYTLSGRTSQDIIIKDVLSQKSVKSVYMPSYCCDSMIEPFLQNGLSVEYYDVFATEAGICCDFNENKCDVVFLINYFGFIDDRVLEFARTEHDKGKTVIYDATHSMFCNGVDYSDCDYVFGSFRKWMGINAGFASKKGDWINKPILKQFDRYVELRNNSFDMKAKYITAPKEVEKNIFFSAFREAEELLDRDYTNYAPDKRSLNLLDTVDVSKIRETRRKNAKCLMKALDKCRNVNMPYTVITEKECPLFVPVMIQGERNRIHEYLIDNGIYLPIHWPISELHKLNSTTRSIYDEEMSCVCDQRYTEEDMVRIGTTIKNMSY